MRTILKISGFLAVVSAAALSSQNAHAQATVYANTNFFSARFPTSTTEVGNEITLAGTYRTVTAFSFEYYLPVASGNETAELRFYKNDSAQTSAGYTAPGTLLYDSGPINIGSGGAQTGATLNFAQADLNGGVFVPDSFTWTVQFGGLTQGETIGTDLYSPPSVGSAPIDMWQNNGGTWQLVTNASFALTMGAEVTATPEPSTTVLLGLGGLLGLSVLMIRNRHRATN